MFLAAHHPSPVHSEVLMEAFWPSAEPKAARNNLHVAIYGLRRSFEDCGCSTQHVVFDSDFYGFATNLTIATDVDAFEAAATRGAASDERGNTGGAITAYREALSLYRGAYVENDPYAEWAQNERRRLHGRLCRLLDDLSRLELGLGDLGACRFLVPGRRSGPNVGVWSPGLETKYPVIIYWNNFYSYSCPHLEVFN